jgi:hypothetical protein
MRKHLSLLLLGTACVGMATVSAQNWVNGGNNLAANGNLGINSNFSLLFETNNIERGRITNGGNWGIGTTSPASRLAVNSSANVSPFRAQINGSTKLIVNGNGGTSIGSSTAGPANGLYVAGNVGIGTTNPNNKLHVEGIGLFTQGITASNGGIIGLNTNGVGVIGEGNTYGFYGSSPNVGVLGRSLSGGHGVDGWSSYIGVYGNGGSYGVYGAGNNTGVYGSGTTYGVYGNSANSIGVVGNSTNYLGGYFYSANYYGLRAATGLSNKNWAGVFDGNVLAYGNYQTSDKNLKKNIEDFTDALSIISKLKPRIYEFSNEGRLASLNLPEGKHYGLIAQELEDVLPNLVKEVENDLPPQPESKPQWPTGPDEKGALMPAPANGSKPLTTHQSIATEKMTVKAINYTELIPLLIKALQEQQQQIDELEQTIIKLTQTPNSLISKGIGMLGQNHPNPVKDGTNIQYKIPQGSNLAQLLITDTFGRQIKTIQLTASGVVNVDVTSLASGVYYYALIIDNKTIQTRKMNVVK